MNKKMFTAIIVITMLASMGTGAFAASKLEEIRAFLNPDLRIKVDGTIAELVNANGQKVVPITYQNTTYLPVRAVSDALNVAVDFDQTNNMVILGEKVDGISITKDFDDMYHTKDPAQTTFMGKDYKEAYFNNGSGNRSAGFMLYPKKQYQTLYLQVAAIGEDLTEFKIKDSDNNILLKTVDVIKAGDGLVTVEVDIGGVHALYIEGSIKSGGTVFVPLTTSYYK